MRQIRIGSLLVTCFLLLLLFMIPKEAEALDLAKNYLEQNQYMEAIDLLENQEVDSLIIGNTYYKAAQSLNDKEGTAPEEIQGMYESALNAYENGIVDEPERVDLKYNYEYVKELIDNKEADESQSDQKNSEEDNQEKQENSQGDNQEDGGNQEESGNNQEDGDNREESGDNQEEQKNSEGEQQSQEEAGESDDISGDFADTGENSEEMSEEALDEGTVGQILKMLEEKEKDSLKNNQQVIGKQGDDRKNDW